MGMGKRLCVLPVSSWAGVAFVSEVAAFPAGSGVKAIVGVTETCGGGVGERSLRGDNVVMGALAGSESTLGLGRSDAAGTVLSAVFTWDGIRAGVEMFVTQRRRDTSVAMTMEIMIKLREVGSASGATKKGPEG